MDLCLRLHSPTHTHTPTITASLHTRSHIVHTCFYILTHSYFPLHTHTYNYGRPLHTFTHPLLQPTHLLLHTDTLIFPLTHIHTCNYSRPLHTFAYLYTPLHTFTHLYTPLHTHSYNIHTCFYTLTHACYHSRTLHTFTHLLLQPTHLLFYKRAHTHTHIHTKFYTLACFYTPTYRIIADSFGTFQDSLIHFKFDPIVSPDT